MNIASTILIVASPVFLIPTDALDTNQGLIPLDTYEKDFTFIVNGKRHLTSRVVADLLSPLIRKLHHVDPSINEFNLENETTRNIQNKDQDYFDDFLSLSSFEVTEIDSNRQKHYQHYF